MSDAEGVLLGRTELERAFTALGERLASRGVVADVLNEQASVYISGKDDPGCA